MKTSTKKVNEQTLDVAKGKMDKAQKRMKKNEK